MAQPQPAARKETKSTGEVVSELWALLKDYGKQETVDPLKSLWRFVSYGSGAALCFGLAGMMFALAIMRIMQVEGRRWLHGNWSFAAYVVAIAVTLAAAYVALKQIKQDKDSKPAQAKKGKTS